MIGGWARLLCIKAAYWGSVSGCDSDVSWYESLDCFVAFVSFLRCICLFLFPDTDMYPADIFELWWWYPTWHRGFCCFVVVFLSVCVFYFVFFTRIWYKKQNKKEKRILNRPVIWDLVRRLGLLLSCSWTGLTRPTCHFSGTNSWCCEYFWETIPCCEQSNNTSKTDVVPWCYKWTIVLDGSDWISGWGEVQRCWLKW